LFALQDWLIFADAACGKPPLDRPVSHLANRESRA
jgi:hypothetical protein